MKYFGTSGAHLQRNWIFWEGLYFPEPTRNVNQSQSSWVQQYVGEQDELRIKQLTCFLYMSASVIEQPSLTAGQQKKSTTPQKGKIQTSSLCMHGNCYGNCGFLKKYLSSSVADLLINCFYNRHPPVNFTYNLVSHWFS